MASESHLTGRFPAVHHATNSEGDLENKIANGSVDFVRYEIHIPLTPDNQTMPMEIAMQAVGTEKQHSLNPKFTAGHDSVTCAHSKKTIDNGESHPQMAVAEGSVCEIPGCSARMMTNCAHSKKTIDNGESHPQMAVAEGSVCEIPGCSARMMTNKQGIDVFPCECGFRICNDCYKDAIGTGDGFCPGCKVHYKGLDESEMASASQPELPESDRRLSAVESTESPMRNQSKEFDFTQYLNETNKSYGYGNAVRPMHGVNGNKDDAGDPKVFRVKQWKPLTRKSSVCAAVLSPYRLLILIRIVVLGLFLRWRISHPNEDAIWLWFMSVICEIWFAFSWLLDQLPKLCPINRAADLDALQEMFETPSSNNPSRRSDLPGIDVFVSTADPEKEPPLVTANTILSILAAEYPVEKLACYVSDDGGALLTFEAMAEAASFARIWVPFCRKHGIEPRNPESYFNLKRYPYKNKVRPDFVRDRRRVKREYDEFKVRINGLSDSIRRRSDSFNSREEVKVLKRWKEDNSDEPMENLKFAKATWMAGSTHWPGTWTVPAPEHSRGDHASIIQVMLDPPSGKPQKGTEGDGSSLDLSEVDISLPMLVYVSREKRPGYEHNKKAGAMNALVRASAIMSNGPFILNLDCDHYIYNSLALREGMCFMMDRDGERICYVQFPQRFEGIDPSDRYANHNTVFFDVNMRALDGIQGPVYVGTGCLFRRTALYGFEPPRLQEDTDCCSCCFPRLRKPGTVASAPDVDPEDVQLREVDEMNIALIPKKFGNSTLLVESVRVAAIQGQPLADHPSVKYGRQPGALTMPRESLDQSTIAESINVISSWYEDKTEWGQSVGWIYGSVTEDVVTGYRMHNRGWRSVYCVTKRDAFRGTAPINLTDRLHQVLRWATGSVEIFFSRNNALLGSPRLKLLQRIAYLNVGIYPFTSIFLIVYCLLPALSLFSGQFIVQTLNVTFLVYLLAITLTLCALAMLEIKWSGIELEEWWRNEQFWLIGGTSAHLAAVLQGLLKVLAGIEISFTLTSKSAGDDVDDDFADLYIFRWTSLMIPPLTIIMVNLIAIAYGVFRTLYSTVPEWSHLLGGVFFSFWVLAHLYPFAKGLMGRRGKTPTIVFVWSGLMAISVSLLWVAIKPPSGNSDIGGSFQFP